MLESYITPLLLSYVDKYIKNLKPTDLNLSLWGGDVSLTNLELNLHALEKELNLPITFLSGKIHELRIHVPWTKLYYEPAVITINTIECVLKLREHDFSSDNSDETVAQETAEIKPSPGTSKAQVDNEKTLPPGYVQSLLNKVLYNLTIKVNNLILKYIEDDIVLSLNLRSAEIHSANAEWQREFVDVVAPDWILHKVCTVTDMTVCLDKRSSTGVIEIYQDPLAYKCNLTCRIQIYYDKEGFHLPLEKNINIYCESLEVSITDQQLPLLLKLAKLGVGFHYGTLDLPACDVPPHPAEKLFEKHPTPTNAGNLGLQATTVLPENTDQPGWLSWAMSMVPAITDEQEQPMSTLEPVISRFACYISQSCLSFKLMEPVGDTNFLGPQRFVFRPILTIEAAGVAMEMVSKGISFSDCQFGVSSLSGWTVDRCVCRSVDMLGKKVEENHTGDNEEELFLKIGGKNPVTTSFLKNSLFDQEFDCSERPELVTDVDECLRNSSESNVMSRYGAVFFQYVYAMNVREVDESGYYIETPLVKEVSHKNIIVGSLLFEVTSDVVHRGEYIMKIVDEDLPARNEKDVSLYNEFMEKQIACGNVCQSHTHVTVLDVNVFILTSDHTKSVLAELKKPASDMNTSLDEIQEEETREPKATRNVISTGCVCQLERLHFQNTLPMYPNELVKLLNDDSINKRLSQYAHNDLYVKVFGFQIGVSKHDIEKEEPLILNVLPACNMSLFTKRSLIHSPGSVYTDIESRFELPLLSVNVTKAQWLLLYDIYTSWLGVVNETKHLSESTLVQDVFHPSVKHGGKVPVLMEISIEEIDAQLHFTTKSISTSGFIKSVSAKLFSLCDDQTESTVIVYGPLTTKDIYTGECFRQITDESFIGNTNEPWLAFTAKIPLINTATELTTQESGAILWKCQGTVCNFDPMLYSWFSYVPHSSPVPRADRTPKGKLLRRTASQSRISSQSTPRKKSYARGTVTGKPNVHKKTPKKPEQGKDVKTHEHFESFREKFDDWVWKKLPYLASIVIQIDVESVVFFAPSSHFPYELSYGRDIARNFVNQLRQESASHQSGMVLTLPAIKIRSSHHQELTVYRDILKSPLILPHRQESETLPWVLTADNVAVFTVWQKEDSSPGLEVYYILDPMCCRGMLASARTSHSTAMASSNHQQATLDFVLHTDFKPLTINCSKKQVDLIFQLCSLALNLTSTNNQDVSHDSCATSVATRLGHPRKRQLSLTSSSGLGAVDEDTLSSEDTPVKLVTPHEATKVSPVIVSLWLQWTLPKLSFHVFGSSLDDGSDLCITTELEDLSASFDYQNGHFKTECKVGNFGISHHQTGPCNQWMCGPGGGILFSQQNNLDSAITKVHTLDSDDEKSDTGPHSFFYMDYTASMIDFPSEGQTEMHDVFQNAFVYRHIMHVVIQPFDVILWCPLLYSAAAVFQRFSVFQELLQRNNDPGMTPPPPSEPEITYQSVTNLPEVSLKMKGFRVVVPTDIISEKQEMDPTQDLFAIQGSSVAITSHPDNKISRVVVDKKLNKMLRGFSRGCHARDADVQYQVTAKGIGVWSGCWQELRRILPKQRVSELDRDLLEQNPALEWNTYNAEDRKSTSILPVVSEFDIKSVIALPIYMNIFSNNRLSQKPIFCLSVEVNISNEVECFVSDSQVHLLYSIMTENLAKNFDVDSSSSESTNVTGGKDSPIHTGAQGHEEEKLDSGVGSENSFRRKPESNSATFNRAVDILPMTCLVTGGGVAVCLYAKAVDGSTLPITRLSFIQPAFTYNKQPETDTLQISLYDICMTKSDENVTDEGTTRTIPVVEDFTVPWFRTGDGNPDKRTELSPYFIHFQSKMYPNNPADIKVDFGRPIHCDLDFDFLRKAVAFTQNLALRERPSKDEHNVVSATTDISHVVRSMALSTCQIACVVIAGSGTEKSSPKIKLALSSLHMGASFKTKEQDYGQEAAANLSYTSLTVSTDIDNHYRSLTQPHDSSIDLEIFRIALQPQSQEGIGVFEEREVVLWLDCGLLQINIGQEHLRCVNLFSDNLSHFVTEYFTPNISEIEKDAAPATSNQRPIIHKSYDDLRTGPFRYVTSPGRDDRPKPYEILFTDEGLPIMTWRYPEPRSLSSIQITPVPFTTFASYPSPVAIMEDRLLPCILRYWDNLQKSYIEHATFYISENNPTKVDLDEPSSLPMADVIAASEWQVVANVSVADDTDESSDDGTSSVYSEQVSPISATSLAACMKVDSVFSSYFVPRLSVALSLNTCHVTIFNHMNKLFDGAAKDLEGFTFHPDVSRDQEILRFNAEGTTAVFKTWPSDTDHMFQTWSNVRGDVLNYRDLRWNSLLSPVDLSLAVVKSHNKELSDGGQYSEKPKLSVTIDCGDAIFDLSQTRLHTLATSMMAWQNVTSITSHFILCNNTNMPIKFGQCDTEEAIVLQTREMTFYSWRLAKPGIRNCLQLCLASELESRWCEPFGIDAPGVVNRVVHFGVHTATLIIEIKKKSGLQRQIIIHSSHVVVNYTSHDIEVQLLQNPALNQAVSPTLQVLHNVTVSSNTSSHSYVISHGGLAGIRVRIRGETTWSGTLPLDELYPGFEQHSVVQMLGTKEFKNFYLWYNAMLVTDFFGQIEISFSPLFLMKNHLAQEIEMTATSCNGDVHVIHEAPGQATEYQIFDLPPDTWHYVTFKQPNVDVCSNPAVPLNTTLHELFEKKKSAESSCTETDKIPWPYSSCGQKSFSTSYTKPAESSLVRHVQSNVKQSNWDKGLERKSPRLELQCQIVQKWRKHRSIVLEVKPSMLFENQCSVVLYMKDCVSNIIFDLEPGQVISPTKIQRFRIGFLPSGLETIAWSQEIEATEEATDGLVLKQHGYVQCSALSQAPNSSSMLSSVILSSTMHHGIRVVTVQEMVRVICSSLPTSLVIWPVILNDHAIKVQSDKMTAHDSQIIVNPDKSSGDVSCGIPYWDVFGKDGESETALRLLLFGLPHHTNELGDSCNDITWSRPVLLQQGIVRQSVSFITTYPDIPLAIVVVTLIENGVITVVLSEDRVPRVLLSNRCSRALQYGQCPTPQEKSRKSKLSGKDLVVSENLDVFTSLPRLVNGCSTFYEPPSFRETFLTKKPHLVPKLKIQFLKQVSIANAGETHNVDLPQGWNDAIDITQTGTTSYDLPGSCRLFVDVTKTTSFTTHVVFRETCLASPEKSLEGSKDDFDIEMRCGASNISICLFDELTSSTTNEVFRVNVQDLSLYVISGDKSRVELLVSGLQLDNQTDNDFHHFPVVLLPLEHESRHHRRMAKRSLKPLIAVTLKFTLNPTKRHFHAINVELEPLSLFVEDTFVYKLAGMIDSFVLPQAPNEKSVCNHDTQSVMLAAPVLSPILIDNLDVSPVYVLVTFHASVKLFVSADHTPLYFSRFNMTSLFTDTTFIAHLLASHYAYSALLKVGWVLGSLDLIGNPASFVRNVGQGLTDFFYLPYEGLTRGPAAFVTGITSGMSSFVSHISAGALNSITNLASSISRNLDRLTFDPQYIELQEELRATGEPRRLLSGFTHGCRGLGLSMLCAVAGVADQPMQELFRAQSLGDATSGVVTGVGKGLIGVVTKPLGGAMELVSQTGQGILQGTGLGEIPTRLHEARHNPAGASSRSKYSWKQLGSKDTVGDLLCVHVSVVVSGTPHFDAILVLSRDCVLFVDSDDDTLLMCFALKQVEMTEDPQHARALLLTHYTPCVESISEISSVATQSTTQPASRDTGRISRQSISEKDTLVLTLFMDPVYTKPLLSRFRFFKMNM